MSKQSVAIEVIFLTLGTIEKWFFDDFSQERSF